MHLFGRVNREASFLRDAVFASTDGLVTTFAVASGSMGAGLSNKIIVILGLANLIADGISMALGIFLGAKSEVEMEKKMHNGHWKQDAPFMQGILTFISFVLSGFIPLIPFVFKYDNAVAYSVLYVFITLIVIGVLKSLVVKKPVVKAVFEMVVVGGLAASAAYFVGDLSEKFLR